MEETTTVTETQSDAQAAPKLKKSDVKAVKPATAYVIKVSAASPVRSVRSAGIVFTGVPQQLPAEHVAIDELKANPWLEVADVTE